MPKNTSGKGGKNFKKAKKGDLSESKRELIFKGQDPEDGDTEYGQVYKLLGQGRVDVQCFDGIKRQGTIRGKMRKKIWVNLGDIILVGLRDFQDHKCDVMHKYLTDEIRILKALGEIPETIIGPKDQQDGGVDDGVRFAEISDSDEEEKKNTEQQSKQTRTIDIQSDSEEESDDEEEKTQEQIQAQKEKLIIEQSKHINTKTGQKNQKIKAQLQQQQNEDDVDIDNI